MFSVSLANVVSEWLINYYISLVYNRLLRKNKNNHPLTTFARGTEKTERGYLNKVLILNRCLFFIFTFVFMDAGEIFALTFY